MTPVNVELPEDELKKVKNMFVTHLNKLHTCRIRANFLEKCLQHKVTPPTLCIKAPKNEACQNPQIAKQYQNAAQSASQSYVKIAHNDAKWYAKDEKKRYEKFRASQLSLLAHSDQNKLIEMLKKIEPQLINKINQKFKQKLQHLLAKNGISQEESSQVPGLKGHKEPHQTRRFIKRNTYKRRKRAEASKQVNLVHNLSQFPLTEDMTKVLNKGLSFVINPRNVNLTEVRSDLQAWKRTVRWREFHSSNKIEFESDSDSESDPPNLFHTKKCNLPPTPPPASLDTFLKGVESEILGSIRKGTKLNVTTEEIKAVQTLKNMQEEGVIRISAVDKGGGTAILDTQEYVAEMLKQHLNSTHKDEGGVEHKYYAPATTSDVTQLCRDIRRVLDDGVQAKYISKQDRKIMEPNDKPGRMYGMPKLHKKIEDGHRLPPLRPIVSGSGCCTEKISEFLDMCVKDEVRKIESFIEDTPHLLRVFQQENLRGPQPDGAFPVTVDVKALYTNIPLEGEDGGLRAFAHALDNRADQRIPTSFLMKLLKLVLQGNYFEFNDKLFLQLIGAAMGTRVACSYACLFMAFHEINKLLGEWNGGMPHLWRRFIDDILFFWHHSVEELEKFINHLNSSHRLIKFSATYDPQEKSVPFLDTVVMIDDQGYIQTDLYKKDCARVQYLIPSSCHPRHICANIPFSLGYRLLRICSQETTFKQRLEELRQDLFSRNYSPKIVDDAFKRVVTISREDALKKVVKKTNERECLAIKFHPGLPSVAKVLKRHHEVMLEEDVTMKSVFPAPSLVCYKRHKNIRDMLIKAKVSLKRRSKRKPTGFKKCHKSGGACMMCLHGTDAAQTHKCNKTGELWKIKSAIDCCSKNIIYKLNCKRCPQFIYVGETSRRAKDRFYQHRSNILTNNQETPAGCHFNTAGHKVTDMIMIPFERVRPANNPNTRKCREKYWINRYQAVTYGANKQKSS